MKIEKYWGGKYLSCLSVYLSHFCLDFNLHPRDWSTPNINIAWSECSVYFTFSLLCTSITFSYDSN